MTKKESAITVWVLDDDKAIGWVLEQTLSQAGFNVRYFEHSNDLIYAFSKETPQLLFSDIRMPDMDGFEVLSHITQNHPEVPVIIMTAFSGIDPAALAFQKGAFEYLPKPFDIDEVVRLAEKATQPKKKNTQAPQQVLSPSFIGKSAALQKIFSTIGRLSTTHVNILITGESGTGKELVAQSLHQYSPRKNKALIALNIAAIPKELIESELFGHEKGSFTGASERKKGYFEQAHEGTLFLDEIGDMPTEVQTRLLRVISTGEFYRIGGSVPIRTDVRILAATHQDLPTMVKAGKFREDLYHRLNIINIHCPPLRERREDIPELCRFFLDRLSKEQSRPSVSIHPNAEEIFSNYEWPGNIRELKNLCQNLFVMMPGDEIGIQDIPEKILIKTERLLADSSENALEKRLKAIVQQYSRDLLKCKKTDIYEHINTRIEKVLIQTVMETTKGHKQKAAKLLGWGRNTLSRKIKEYSPD